ncbi:hypothetical protein YC2023_110312 [Brassica napus]
MVTRNFFEKTEENKKSCNKQKSIEQMLDEYEFMDSLVEVRGGMTDEQCHQLWESGKTFFHAYMNVLINDSFNNMTL